MAVKLRKAGALRAIALLMTLFAALFSVSCGEKKSEDEAMTEALIRSYMDSLCDYNISGMNKCCMGGVASYGDGKQVVRACRSVASRIEWETESVTVNGSSAVARIKISVPADVAGICSAALDDAVGSFDAEPESNPYELLAAAVKKRAGKAELKELSAEVTMTKVANKWYIIKSSDVTGILSEIRTPVAAVFDVLANR